MKYSIVEADSLDIDAKTGAIFLKRHLNRSEMCSFEDGRMKFKILAQTPTFWRTTTAFLEATDFEFLPNVTINFTNNVDFLVVNLDEWVIGEPIGAFFAEPQNGCGQSHFVHYSVDSNLVRIDANSGVLWLSDGFLTGSLLNSRIDELIVNIKAEYNGINGFGKSALHQVTIKFVANQQVSHS